MRIKNPIFKCHATTFRKGQIWILECAISKLKTEISELRSLYKLYTIDTLTQPFRRFRRAIERCLGDSEDQVEAGMDQVVYMLAICNVPLELMICFLNLLKAVEELPSKRKFAYMDYIKMSFQLQWTLLQRFLVINVGWSICLDGVEGFTRRRLSKSSKMGFLDTC